MAEYDFSTLSPLDFERLVRDLLSKSLRLRLESFSVGRDGGLDFRGREIGGGTIIGQCKHYLRTGFAGLKSNCNSKELPKVRRANPTRYILATSVPLNPAQKQELCEALAPWCLGPEDILGQGDLNALLRVSPEIERTHFKLWLSSMAVLDRVVHAASYARGSLLLGDLKRRISLFVPNASVPQAERVLAEHRYCVISGIPGIGKTTLAEVLCARHIAQGYEVVVIGSDAAEAFDRYSEDSKQLFYYDDFLGQTAVDDKLNPKEDGELVRLLNAVRQNTSKRMILTTREYILNQARRRYERLERAGLKDAQCVVSLEDYSRANRAEILYNHLHFSAVAEERIARLMTDGGHRQVIDHPNYNPRTVEGMCASLTTIDLSPDEWVRMFMETLSSPSKIWSHAFWNQIDELDQALVLVAASLPNIVSTEALERAWVANVMEKGRSRPSHADFRRVLGEIDGTFLHVFSIHGKYCTEVHNPSVRDFARVVLQENGELLQQLIGAATCFEQIQRIVSWFDSDGLSASNATALVSAGLRVWSESPVDVSIDSGRPQELTSSCPASRLAALVPLARTMGQVASLLAVVDRVFVNTDPRVSIEGVVTLLESVQHDCVSYKLGNWASAVLESCLANAENEDDFAYLVRLLSHVGPGDRDGYKRRVRTEFERAMSGVEWDYLHDEQSTTDVAATIVEIAERLDLDPTPWLYDLDRRAKALEEEAAEREPDDYDSWKDSRFDAAMEDREIDAMFSTLLD